MEGLFVIFVIVMVARSIIRQNKEAQKRKNQNTHRPAPKPRASVSDAAFPPAQRTSQRPKQQPKPRPAAQPKPAAQPVFTPAEVDIAPEQPDVFVSEQPHVDVERPTVRPIASETVAHGNHHHHIERVETQAEGYAGEGDPARYNLRDVSCETVHDAPKRTAPKLSFDKKSVVNAVIFSEILGKPRALGGGKRP